MAIMSSALSQFVEAMNRLGTRHVEFATAMFWQLAIVIAVLTCLDAVLLRRMRASLRYGVWSLGLVKLVLPVTLLGPIGYLGWMDAVSTPPRVAASLETSAAAMSVRINQKALAGVQRRSSTGLNAANSRPLAIEPHAQAPSLVTLRWQGALLLGWVCGVVVLAALFVRQILLVNRLVTSSSPASDRFNALFHDVLKSSGIDSRRVSLRMTHQLSTPAICGLQRATILLPESLVPTLDDEQLRLVLTHELLHWKRLDPQLNVLQSIVQILYFYNPAVWMLNAVVRRLREHAVDEAVLVSQGASIQRYGEMLLEIAEGAESRTRFAPALTGILPSPNALSTRIRRMVSRPLPRKAPLGLGGFLVVTLLGLVMLPLAGREPLVVAADPPPQNSAAEETDSTVQAAPATAESVHNVAADEIAGIVVDEAGRPIEGVLVDAYSWFPGNETRTNASGVFRLKGFDPNDRDGVEAFFTKEGWSPAHFNHRMPGQTDWKVAMGRKTYFEGTIVDAEGQPVGGAVIHASFDVQDEQGNAIGKVFTREASRDDGTFRVYATANNPYELQFAAPGRGVARLAGQLVVQNESKTLKVALEKGATFEARVIDSVVGAPVQGFILWQWQGEKLLGKSDADGRIAFNDLFPGKVEFNCGGGEALHRDDGFRYYQHGPFGRWWSEDAVNPWQKRSIDDPALSWQRNFDDLEFNLKPDMPPVTIVVEQGVTVSGHVTDPNGQSVEGATVAPAKTGSGNSLTGDTRYSVKTDKNGAYSVVLPASNDASYNLMVHDGDYHEWRHWANGVAAPMKTSPGQVIENFDLQLTRPAVIRGQVTINGKPVANREVRTHDFDKQENRYYDPTVLTDAEGKFELKFVRPGKHYLQVEPFWLDAQDARQGSTVVEVEAGQILEGIDLSAPQPQGAVMPAPDVRVRVLDENRQPVVGVPVGSGVIGALLPVGSDLDAAGFIGERTDENGIADAHAEALIDLHMTAMVYAVDHRNQQSGFTRLNLDQLADVAMGDGPETIDVVLGPAFPVAIQVKATAFENREPLRNISLTVMRDSLPLLAAGLKVQDVVKPLLPSGDYQLFVSYEGCKEPVQAAFTIDAETPAPDITIELR